MRKLHIIFYFSFLLFCLVFSLHPQDASSAQVTLAWDPNIEPDIEGYKLYYGTASRNYSKVIDVGNVTDHTVYNLTNGITYYFAVKAYNVYGLKSDYSNEVSIPVHIISPDRGEIIPSGSTYNITWEAVSKITKFNLLYSLDNGLTWIPIPNATRITDTYYNWTIPKPWGNKKNKCLVKVIGFDTKSFKVGADRSDAPFTIEVVKITSPIGGETLTSGNEYTIKWTTHATKRYVAKVKLYYTKDGGITWFLIEELTDYAYLPEGPHSYPWTPTVWKPKEMCKIKVELKDADGNVLGQDGSDGYFSIQP